MEPEIKVTRINNRWHARLIVDGKIYDEMACANRVDIGWICREMLRWLDKMGGGGEFASAARHRQHTGAQGRVWYLGYLITEMQKRKANELE